MRLLTTVGKLSLILCFCLISRFAKAQDSLIVWQGERPLQWADFTAPVDAGSKFQASTFSLMRYTYNWHRQNGVYTLTFKVHAYMNTKRSWMVAGRQSDRLLAHEQSHFDLTELYARKLLQVFKAQTYHDDYREVVIQLGSEMEAERKAAQKRYDEETNHYVNRDRQAEWDEYIKQQLLITPKSE